MLHQIETLLDQKVRTLALQKYEADFDDLVSQIHTTWNNVNSKYPNIQFSSAFIGPANGIFGDLREYISTGKKPCRTFELDGKHELDQVGRAIVEIGDFYIYLAAKELISPM